jgi:hypothetical protein
MRNILIALFAAALFCFTGIAVAETQLDSTVKQTQDELSSDKMNADTNSSSDIQKLHQKSDASINVDEPVTKKDASKKTNTTLEKGKSHTAKPKKGGVDVYGGAKSNTGKQTQDNLSSDKMNADTNSSSDIQKLHQKSDANINVDEPMTKKDASKKTNTTLEKGKSHTAEPTKGGVDVYGGAKSDTETK